MAHRSGSFVVVSFLLILLIVCCGPVWAAPLSLGNNTWMARALPVGYGKSPVPGGAAKHGRAVHNPVDGLLYWMSGDWKEVGFSESGVQSMYTYNVATDTWTKIVDYCNGATQVFHPDQVGVVYDTRRNIIWMLGGYQGGSDTCPAPTEMIKGKIMTFDPATKLWTNTGLNEVKSANNLVYASGAVYDPRHDKSIMFAGGEGSALNVAVFDHANNTWITKNIGAGLPTHTNLVQIQAIAIDQEHSIVYAIDNYYDKLYSYNVGTGTFSLVGDAPLTPHIQNDEQFSQVFWDSVNKVLLYPWYKGGDGVDNNVITLYVYDPANNTWSDGTTINNTGQRIVGRQGTFDPYQNVLVLAGINNTPLVPYVFLYRYKNVSGDTSPPTGNIAPSPPTGFKVK